MKVLIVGVGYSGNRFVNAFEEINRERIKNSKKPIEIICVNRSTVEVCCPLYYDFECALEKFCPDIVVVAVTDGNHHEIINKLYGYRGFVICEKPLVNCCDDLNKVKRFLQRAVGFGMNMVERYSDITQKLRDYVYQNSLTLRRAHFIWGKDRINDHRETSGAVSEMIHSLDLVEYVMDDVEDLDVCNAIGAYSDFSVSGDSVLDSVYIGGQLNNAVVTGYSSFVNVVRQRTVDFVFGRPDGTAIYANCVYDTPCWDMDRLSVWDPDCFEDFPLLDIKSDNGASMMETPSIAKLSRLVREIVGYVECENIFDIKHCGLNKSIQLQELLNKIEARAESIGTYSIRGKRTPSDRVINSSEILG